MGMLCLLTMLSNGRTRAAGLEGGQTALTGTEQLRNTYIARRAGRSICQALGEDLPQLQKDRQAWMEAYTFTMAPTAAWTHVAWRERRSGGERE